MRAAAILSALAAATPASADAGWMYGDWCSTNGEEHLMIEETGIGFNEHTICQWLEGKPGATTTAFKASCANVYLSGNETVRMDERIVTVTADEGRKELIVDGQSGSRTIFRACET